jgi:hypothetical protein
MNILKMYLKVKYCESKQKSNLHIANVLTIHVNCPKEVNNAKIAHAVETW